MKLRDSRIRVNSSVFRAMDDNARFCLSCIGEECEGRMALPVAPSTEYFIKAFVRDERDGREYSSELRRFDSVDIPEEYSRQTGTKKATEKEREESERQKLAATTHRYFMSLRPSIPTPFPERFLVADYLRDLVFQ